MLYSTKTYVNKQLRELFSGEVPNEQPQTRIICWWYWDILPEALKLQYYEEGDVVLVKRAALIRYLSDETI